MFFLWHTKPSKIDEARLLKEARGGDRESLGALLEMHRNRLRTFLLASPRLRDSGIDLIEDAIQECFAQVTQQIRTVQLRGAFANYLTGIAVHRCYDIVRKSHRSRTSSVEDSTLAEIPDPSSADDKEAIDTHIDLTRALERASEYERLILRLYYEDAAQLRVISLIVGKSQAQVSRDIKKARQNLALLLKN
ncbi:MAG: RNA polymerase sigma factor [Candidatus Marsarchaeota archaeon]|nr:RNA polymerase sigma factor [Candidatus Marsarchaeota archaeon]